MREEENFAVKTHIHDEVGAELGFTHNLLAQKECSLDELHAAGKRWERIAGTLGLIGREKEGSAVLPAETAMAELVATIAGIGVTVELKGPLPNADKARYLLSVAMRECAVNTVRHGGGSAMTVELSETGKTVSAAITNNGSPPQGCIVEGGGLGALRRRVESAGGSMTVESAPRFRLLLTLPAKEETL